MNLRKLTLSAIAFCAVASAGPAHAHFLWGEVTPEATPIAKLALSDRPGEPSEDDMVERIKGARAWNGNGQEIKFTSNSTIRFGSLEGSKVFSSAQYYGVLDKTKEGRGVFRCMYYAKAVLDISDAGQNLKLPFELFGRRDTDGQIVVTAKRGEAIYEGAKLNVFQPGRKLWVSYVTDAKGEIRFETPVPGIYGIKAAWIDETPGEVEGKKYPFTRNYSTLTFRVNAPTAQ